MTAHRDYLAAEARVDALRAELAAAEAERDAAHSRLAAAADGDVEARFVAAMHDALRDSNLSQSALARAMTAAPSVGGWHQPMIARVLAGRRPLRLNEAAAFARLLGIDLDRIVCGG